MDISNKLMLIQTQIKAPKNMYNSFGKYKYRNAEGICEAAKPYLTEHKCCLTLSDDIVAVGERIYVKSTATLEDIESHESVSVSAFARESLEKKGMDDSQITGTASSYARKYALNGLFLLDDTKDADTDEYKMQTDQKNEDKPQDSNLINSEQVGKLKIEMLRTGATEEYLCKYYKLEKLIDMSVEQWTNAMEMFKKTPDRKKN